MKIFSVFLLCVLAACYAKDCPSKKINSKLLCYYSKLKNIDNCYCTHVILPADADLKTIENLRQKLNGVKILLTVNEFHQGLIDTVKQNKIDGLELNLKKLDSKNDITEFINTVRTRLGNDLFLALSIPPKTELLAKYYDMKALTKTTDLFILQTAFLGASKNVTFHPSRLSGMWDMQNTDSVVDLVTGLGAPLSRLAITAPVQAFKFTLQDTSLSTPGSPALEITTMTRTELCDKMSNGDNWTLERDQDQAGPYIFRDKEWISFEDATSMDIKAKYSRVRGLAGLALKDLSMDEDSKKCGASLLEAAHAGLSKQNRAPRAVVLKSLEREILETQARPLRSVNVSPYRISRVIDVEGHVHVIRQDTRTEFECSRQGYFVHPHSCGRFYRCVKFDQQSEEFSVFEFDCPAGLAFDARVEVCVWPGSLPDGAPCSGSSEIAPVPKERFGCPSTPGYYADPENCRWFFACLDHGKSGLTAYEFRCPFGLVFDEKRLLCEWSWLVPTCGSGHHSGLELDSVEFFGGSAKSTLIHGQQTGLGVQTQLHGLGSGANVLESYDGLGSLGTIALGGYQGDLNTLKQGLVLGYDNSGNLAHSNLENFGADQLNSRFKIGGYAGQGIVQLNGGTGFENNGQYQGSSGQATSQFYGNLGGNGQEHQRNSGQSVEFYDNSRNSGQSNLEYQGRSGTSSSQLHGSSAFGNNGQYQENSGVKNNGQSSSEYQGNSGQPIEYHGNSGSGIAEQLHNSGETAVLENSGFATLGQYEGKSGESTIYHENSGFGSKLNSEFQENSRGASIEYNGNSGQNIAFADFGLRQDSGRNIAFSNLQNKEGHFESGSLQAGNTGFAYHGAQNLEALNQANVKLATGTEYTSNVGFGSNLGKKLSESFIEYHGNHGQSGEQVSLFDSAINTGSNIDHQYNANSNINNENNQGKLNVVHFGTNYEQGTGQASNINHGFNSGIRLEQANIGIHTADYNSGAKLVDYHTNTGGLVNLDTNAGGSTVYYEKNNAYNSEQNKHNVGATSSQSIVTHHQGGNDKIILENIAYKPEHKSVLLDSGIKSAITHHGNTGEKLIYTNEGANFNLQNNRGLEYQSNLDNSAKIATSTVHLNSGHNTGEQILVGSGEDTRYSQQEYGNGGAKSSASTVQYYGNNEQNTLSVNSGVNHVHTGATSSQYYGQQNYGSNAQNLQFDSIKYQSVPAVQQKVEYPTLVQQYGQANAGNLNYNYQYANEAKYNAQPTVSHTSTSHANVGSFDKYNGDTVVSHTPKLNYNIQVPTSITYDTKLTHGLSSNDVSVHGANVYSESIAGRPVVNSDSHLTEFNYATNYIAVTPKTDIFKLGAHRQSSYHYQAPTVQYQQNIQSIPYVKYVHQEIKSPVQQNVVYNANSGAKSHSSFVQHHTAAIKTPSVVLTKVEAPTIQYQQNIQTIPYEQTQYVQQQEIKTPIIQQNLYNTNSGAKSHSSFVQHHTTNIKTPSVVLTKVESPISSNYETHYSQVNIPVVQQQQQVVLSKVVQQPSVVYQAQADSGAKSHSSFVQHHTTNIKTPSVVLTKVESPISSNYETHYSQQVNIPVVQQQQQVVLSKVVQQPSVVYQAQADSGAKSHSSFVQHHTTNVKTPSVVLTNVESPITPKYETHYLQQQQLNVPAVQQQVVLPKVVQQPSVVYQPQADFGAKSHASFVQHHTTNVKTPSVVLTKVESPITPKYETHYLQQQLNVPVVQQQVVLSKVEQPSVVYQTQADFGAKSHASFVQVQTPIETVSVSPKYETQYYQQQGKQSQQQISYNVPVIQQPSGFVVSSTPKYESHYYQKQIVPIVQQQVLTKVEQPNVVYKAQAKSGAQSHSSFVQHHTTDIKTPSVVLTKVQTPIQTVTPQYETQHYGQRIEQVQPIQYQVVQKNIPTYQAPEIKSSSYNIQQHAPIQTYDTYAQPNIHTNFYEKQIHQESVSASPAYETYSYSPPKQQIKYESREYLPPKPAVSSVFISSTPKYVPKASQVYVSTTPKYAVFQEFIQPKQTFEIKKTVVPVTPTYQTYSGPTKYESTFYGTHGTVTSAPNIVESYSYLPPKQVISNIKYESRDYLPPKSAESTVYVSTPKHIPAKAPQVYVSTTPKYAVFQEYIQPKQTYEIKKTVSPTVVSEYQYENAAYQNYESNLNYKQDYAYVAPKVQTETIYYQTQKPYVSSTYRPVQVKNYQTQYIISSPKPNFVSAIAPVIKQTPRVRTKVVALTKFETLDNKYFVSTPKPIYYSTPEPIITESLSQQLPAFKYYDSRFDTGTQNEYVTPKTYVAPQETVTAVPKTVESYSYLPPKQIYYDSRFDTGSQKSVEKEIVTAKAYETFKEYVTPGYVQTQETVTVAPKIVESYSYLPPKQVKYESREYLPPKSKTIYVSTTPTPYLPPNDETYQELPEFKYYDSRLDTASQKSTNKESEQYFKETSDYSDQFGNYEFVSEPVSTIRPIQRKKIISTTTFAPRESYSNYDDTFDSQYIISTPRPKVVRPVLRKKIVTTTAVPLERFEPVITTLRPKLVRPNIKKKIVTTEIPYYDNYESSSIEPVYETVITPKPKSKTIVRVNDFHPFLTTKLGAQCTCTSNTLKLTQKSKPKDAFDFNYNLPDNVPVTKYNGDGLASYDNYEQPGVYVVDSSEGSDDYNYEAQKIVAVTQSPKVLIKSTTNAAQPAPTPIYTLRRRVTSVAPEIYISSTPAPSFRETVFLKKSQSVSIVDKSKEEKIAEAVNEGLSLVKSAIKGYVKEAVEEETRNLDRFGPGGWRSRDETLQGSVDCQRTGLFRHPTQCNKFYACHWDCTKQRYTLHVFNCPVHLTFDSTQGACNWPSKGPSCTDNTLLPSS